MTAGVGPLSIVASQDIGDLGTRESSSAVVHWRWYYHFPSLGLWAVLVALLVLVKANRRGQAWLILLPVLVVALGGSMLARLLSLPPEDAELFGGVLVALAASWAAIWLLAPWLAGRSVAAALLLAMATMLSRGRYVLLQRLRRRFSERAQRFSDSSRHRCPRATFGHGAFARTAVVMNTARDASWLG